MEYGPGGVNGGLQRGVPRCDGRGVKGGVQAGQQLLLRHEAQLARLATLRKIHGRLVCDGGRRAGGLLSGEGDLLTELVGVDERVRHEQDRPQAVSWSSTSHSRHCAFSCYELSGCQHARGVAAGDGHWC